MFSLIVYVAACKVYNFGNTARNILYFYQHIHGISVNERLAKSINILFMKLDNGKEIQYTQRKKSRKELLNIETKTSICF